MSWAVATVNPILAGLAARDLTLVTETFAPRHRENRWAPARQMFPGYLFIRPVREWRAVLSARGVRGILGLGLGSGQACLVRDSEMEHIFAALDDDGVYTEADQPDPYHPGAAVRSRLLGWLGVVLEVTSPDNFSVDFAAMGRRVRVATTRADLVLA